MKKTLELLAAAGFGYLLNTETAKKGIKFLCNKIKEEMEKLKDKIEEKTTSDSDDNKDEFEDVK